MDEKERYVASGTPALEGGRLAAYVKGNGSTGKVRTPQRSSINRGLSDELDKLLAAKSGVSVEEYRAQQRELLDKLRR